MALTSGQLLLATGATQCESVDAGTARSALGLGTLAQQNANNVLITGGSISGITALPVASGGTGSGSAAGARTNLGLVIGTDVQAYDAELAALAGLTSAADKGIQFTGSGTAATYDLTAAGKALLDDADASAQRTTLGLVIGTNVQAYDAELAALAGLTSAANKIPRYTGSGTADLLDFKDEDDMASNSATALPSQQSVKAYIDAAVAAATVADGDKGDLTVSSSGTVWTIDADAVTYAKIQDVSATDKLLGRSTAGAGVIEEITCTAFGRSLIDDAAASNARTTLGLVIGTDVAAAAHASAHAAGGADQITSLYLANTGLKVVDTNASHGLIFKPGSDLTADRTLTITTGDADRTFTLSGNLTVSGTATLPAGTALVAANNLSDIASATTARTNLGLVIGTDVAAQSHASQHEAGGSDAIDSIYFSNTGCKIVDTNASHGLTIKPGSDLTADRIFTLTTGDAARTLTINGDTTLGGGSHSGTNTGDEAAASDTVAGKIEIAVQSEMEAITDTTRAVVPGRIKYSPHACKAWAQFDLTAAPASVVGSLGNDSITDSGTGDITWNFLPAFSATTAMCVVVSCFTYHCPTSITDTTSVRLLTYNSANALTDVTPNFMAIFGDYA